MSENTGRPVVADLDAAALTTLHATLLDEYAALQARGLRLDITRGKPSPEQLDLAQPLLGLPGEDDFRAADGTDTRNYGGLAGLPELRAIYADLLGIPVEQLLASGTSSLTVMFDVLAYAFLFGRDGSPQPWGREEKVRWICPVPGYDRHFAMLEHLGIEMVTVDQTPDGPDVEAIARLVADDPTIKGLWLVPTYSNPGGETTSAEVAARLAAMPAAAPDFTVLWDNAYAVHHLTDDESKAVDVLGLAAASGHPDRFVVFASTSKVTFAGAGVAFLAGSPSTVAWYLRHLAFGSIGPDKVNHLRHVRFLRDADGVRAHMHRHREILEPKFGAVLDTLDARLGGTGTATWNTPRGGYFVSLDVVDGTARRVVELAREAGIALTPAGASFPYGHDPRDRNIRIAPTFPPVDEIRVAIDGLATCVLLAAVEQRLS
ncbi:aminotransferase class I/II-fold pyridoxal phosphate-dependent enzyme [Luteimicrobium subarcticum]|uniref:DNA-binding transcriptional MocR family regulator n=1 Tax=Luteimicrobium subarcticum TaxID=620910 RepID=A0A2M8WV36_9MICO|nr:aminotransferase class I/II-fold pyridoxal phosphate-dependent enzyme [Luteimicrobium subarcticum]PJI94779.1 DNA-binding transcriptional MocR family regulator [Luteimicrobium subarcticum]